MPLSLQRASLADQICGALRAGLDRREWAEWLPGERRLCAAMNVGRNSLRAALRMIAAEGRIEIVPGQGCRVLDPKPAPARVPERPVALLSPLPLERLRPSQTLWIDELRVLLAEQGRALRLIHGPQYYRPNPTAALQRLVDHERCGCWILVLTNRATQGWFERRGIPCVIAGTCHKGLQLPFVDLDYRAMARHAATTLLQHGHRQVALLTPDAAAAGNLQTEEGFREGVKALGETEPGGAVIRHGPEKTHIVHCIRQLLQRPRPPTGLVVSNSYVYLTVVSVLAGLGRQVPRDLSLICRDDDRFLSYLEPEPARYVEDPHMFARKLARITSRLKQGASAPPAQVLLVPRLVTGASIGRGRL